MKYTDQESFDHVNMLALGDVMTPPLSTSSAGPTCRV